MPFTKPNEKLKSQAIKITFYEKKSLLSGGPTGVNIYRNTYLLT